MDTNKNTHKVSPDLYYKNTEIVANKFLTLRLTQQEFTRLNDVAKSKETTRTAFVRNLIFSLI